MSIEDSIKRLREAPRGYVLVKAYNECGADTDDAPGLRGECQTKLRVGAPCEKCPRGESSEVLAHLLAALDEREAAVKAERDRWHSACYAIAADLRNHDMVRLGAAKCLDAARKEPT